MESPPFGVPIAKRETVVGSLIYAQISNGQNLIPDRSTDSDSTRPSSPLLLGLGELLDDLFSVLLSTCHLENINSTGKT